MNPAEVQLKMASFWLHICAARHHHWPEHQSLVAGLVAMLSLHGPGCRVRGICATHCSCPQTWALASPQPTAWADTGTRVIRSGSVWIQSLTAATRRQTAALCRATARRYLDNFLWLWGLSAILHYISHLLFLILRHPSMQAVLAANDL